MSKRILQGAAAGLLLLVLSSTIAARAGVMAVNIDRPEGHFFWYLSRASGITAYLALTLELVFGLLLSTAVGDRLVARGRSVEVHQWLSALTLSLLAVHGMALLGDRFIQFDMVDVLVPFVAPYEPIAVGLGVIAAWLGAAVHVSFEYRKRLGQRAWRMLHYASFPMFWMVTAHGLLAGTDSRGIAMRAMYAACAALVLWLTFYRVIGVARELQPARAALGCPATCRNVHDGCRKTHTTSTGGRRGIPS